MRDTFGDLDLPISQRTNAIKHVESFHEPIPQGERQDGLP